MAKIFTGYTIARGWKKLTLFEFNAKTHARMSVTEVRPFPPHDMALRREAIRNRLRQHGLPRPPFCFDPK